jgi:PadR family transcriptional regulator PadR
LTFDNKRRHIVDNLGIDDDTARRRRRSIVAGAKTDLLQGTLDLLILKTLALGKLHGWGISKRIQQVSQGVLEVNQGSLYPALYRLEDRGLIEAEWGISPEGRRAKFYALTAKGKGALREERRSWKLFSEAVELILQASQ